MKGEKQSAQHRHILISMWAYRLALFLSLRLCNSVSTTTGKQLIILSMTRLQAPEGSLSNSDNYPPNKKENICKLQNSTELKSKVNMEVKKTSSHSLRSVDAVARNPSATHNFSPSAFALNHNCISTDVNHQADNNFSSKTWQLT